MKYCLLAILFINILAFGKAGESHKLKNYLLNLNQGSEYFDKFLEGIEKETFIKISKCDCGDGSLRIQATYKKKFIDFGKIYFETSYFYHGESNKIYLTNFTTLEEKIVEGENGIHVYDFKNEQLVRLTSEREGETSFYYLVSFDQPFLYYKKVTVKKTEVLENAKLVGNNKYFEQLKNKLLNEKKIEKLKVQ